MDDFVNIYEKPYRDMTKMTKEELSDELGKWRNLWTWLPEDVQYWLTRIRSQIRIVNRSSKNFEGLLGQLHWELTAIDVDSVERNFNYFTNQATYETKTSTVPVSAILFWEFIHAKEVVDEPQPRVGESLHADILEPA